MRVAIYAIALNEAANVPAWFASAREADHILLLDTGSTDRTIEIARVGGVEPDPQQDEAHVFVVAFGLGAAQP